MKTDFDIKDKSTWHATCAECGNKKMEYNEHQFKYYCNKCGYILEV